MRGSRGDDTSPMGRGRILSVARNSGEGSDPSIDLNPSPGSHLRCDPTSPTRGEVAPQVRPDHLSVGVYPPAFSAASRRTSSESDDDTDGTRSPSEAREMAARVWLKMASALSADAARLARSSVIKTLWWPSESSTTLPGVAEERINAFSDAATIGARPWEKVRKRRS